ncbi:MAG: hypothetical protein V4613_09715 [Bacteroidota bacterium]
MKGVYIKLALIITAGCTAVTGYAAEIKNFGPKGGGSNQTTQRDVTEFSNTCKAATQSADLDINNVRTKILNGGDMWWDLNNPRYEIPKVTDANTVRKNSLFSGALWIGGLGRGDGNLRIAAMTYRQTGNDFWPGTLDTTNVSTDPARCEAWDKMFKVTRDELILQQTTGEVSKSILEWPAAGNPNVPYGSSQADNALASFFDVSNGGPIAGPYDPTSGDYPILDPSREPGKNLPKDQPDQMIWFAYNDRGNVHSETGGIPIGLELQTTAFAFQTNDEVNNMTFYTTKIINRGFEALDNTYFGEWVDADLGNYADDYVGCDVGRSLGYCYNGDDNDDGVLGYGLNPPSVGVDFFEGPIDTSGKQLGMGAFMYYNNNSDAVSGNPNTAIDFYNYLQAKWQNGSDVTYGGNGINATTIKTKYMFDDGTNPANDPNASPKFWNEYTAGNPVGDRRFLQSAGPFTLTPGAINKITVGVVWARTTSGGARGSLNLLKLASDKAQKLFNNKFDIADGPEPPVVEIQELENSLVLKFLDTKITEDYKEDIKNELNQIIKYRFQGYMIYQLKDGSVSNTELNDIDKAVLIGQCDIKDNISQMINLEFDATVSANIPKEKVSGKNEGIQHTFNIKEDAFAAGSSKTLVNFKTYYFLVLAYGYPSNDPLKLEPEQFLPSRRTVLISGIPHKTSPEAFGSNQQSNYGDGPMLKQLSGRGNGGQVLEFTKETIDEIMANGKANEPVYLGGKGPVKIKIVDPLLVPKADFEFQFIEKWADRAKSLGTSIKYQDSISAKSYWRLINKTTNDTVYADSSLENIVETVEGRVRYGGPVKKKKNLREWGLAVEIAQVPSPGRNPYGETSNGLIGFEVKFADEGNRWLTAVPDIDQESSPFNWIRSGTKNPVTFDPYNDDFNADFDPNHNGTDSYDPYENFEKIWDRRIAPYAFCSRVQGPSGRGEYTYGPAWGGSTLTDNPIVEIASIKLVITPDVRKWSQCAVLEMGEDATLTEGNMAKMNLRYHNSMKPVSDGNGNFLRWEEDASERGRSYFPGYAINLETGQRLNIVFGEDSYLPNENGSDMIWNPTSNYANSATYYNFGGKHYIYVMGSYPGLAARSFLGPIYDGGATYQAMLQSAPNTSPTSAEKRKVLSQAMWVIPAMAERGFDLKTGVPPNEVSITINMRKPYTKQVNDTLLPRYTFNTESVYNDINSETGKKSVNLINIVPNPYYAYSEYEGSAIDNKVKITNLPPKATISVYTLSGTLVRRIKKDDLLTFSDWDLKNDNRVPVASGFYIIHVDCGDLGEKILKWYGVMRQLDLDSY